MNLMIFKLGSSGFEYFMRPLASRNGIYWENMLVTSGGIATSRCQNLKSKGRIRFLHLESASSRAVNLAVFRCESSRLRAAQFFSYHVLKRVQTHAIFEPWFPGSSDSHPLKNVCIFCDIVFARLLLAIFLPQIVPQISDLELVWPSHIPPPCNFHRMRVLSQTEPGFNLTLWLRCARKRPHLMYQYFKWLGSWGCTIFSHGKAGAFEQKAGI
jgi:hypothetical protein